MNKILGVIILLLIIITLLGIFLLNVPQKTENRTTFPGKNRSEIVPIPTGKNISTITNISKSIDFLIKNISDTTIPSHLSISVSLANADYERKNMVHTNVYTHIPVERKKQEKIIGSGGSTPKRGPPRDRKIKIYKREGNFGNFSLLYDSGTPTVAISWSDFEANKTGQTYFYYSTIVSNGKEVNSSAIVSITVYYPMCTDTDQDDDNKMGFNLKKRGSLIINGTEYEDYCFNNETVNEYWCPVDMKNVFWNGFKCICQDGRCV